MIDPEHDLPIKQQAEVLCISRSTVYYEPRPISEEDLWLMRRLDELHLLTGQSFLIFRLFPAASVWKRQRAVGDPGVGGFVCFSHC